LLLTKLWHLSTSLISCIYFSFLWSSPSSIFCTIHNNLLGTMFFMTEVNHQRIKTNGINIHVAEQGTGPLVLLLHGFPEIWYSWRHQLNYLAQNGYHAVAPDLRIWWLRFSYQPQFIHSSTYCWWPYWSSWSFWWTKGMYVKTNSLEPPRFFSLIIVHLQI
jgi:hypothetical protein